MRLGLLVVLMPAALAQAAPVADGKALLRRGMALYREASYAASVAALEQARRRSDLERPERVECAFYLGANYVAMGSLSAARRELRNVLELDPDFELPPYTSPKVAALFREARDEVARLPRLTALPPERRAAGGLEVRFRPERAGGRVYGVVAWRWRGDPSFHEAPLLRDGDLLVATVPLGQRGTLEYYAEARAPAGPLAVGSAERPLTLPVAMPDPVVVAPVAPAADRPGPGRRLWWLWTGISVVAAAGLGVGLYFALRPSNPTADAVLDFQVR